MMDLTFEKMGMLPTLEGYDPRMNLELPKGFTAEYYGDDIIYVGYGGKCIAQIWDQPDVHIKTQPPILYLDEDIREPALEVLTDLRDEIKKVEEKFPVETYAGRHLGNK